MNVRSTPGSDRTADIADGPFRAMSDQSINGAELKRLAQKGGIAPAVRSKIKRPPTEAASHREGGDR
jgi:hypothetical protein